MVTTTFTTAQDVLDAPDTRPTATVYIGGVTVPIFTWSAQFGIDQVSTCRIDLPLPRPASVIANAVVEIMGGHNDYVGRLFSGRITGWKNTIGSRGATCSVRAVGWSSLLTYPERFDLIFDGPISPAAIFDALCVRRGVPAWELVDMTDPTNTIPIVLGSNPQVDDGKVKIGSGSNPLSTLRSSADPFYHYVYDIPGGAVRLARVSGQPTGTPVAVFVEGTNSLWNGDSDYDITGLVNYPNIEGPTYEDEYGASIPIRAFPAAIPSSPLVPVNDGISYRSSRNSLLDTQQLAEIALAYAQINEDAPSTPVRWEAAAVPGISPGDVVTVTSPTLEAEQAYWLVAIDFSGDRGLTATYDGWIGSGEATPPGNNLQVTRIQTGVTHLGDETRSNYAVPTPSGLTAIWDIEIPDRATAVAFRFWHHGTNSQVQGGVETDLEVSTFEVWLPGVDMDDEDNRPETSGKLAILNENLSLNLPYNTFVVDGDDVVTDPGHWKPGAVNLDRLDAGAYKVRLRAGKASGYDDFEIRLLDLHVYGRSEPVIVPQEV